jgi:hypothetical protein
MTTRSLMSIPRRALLNSPTRTFVSKTPVVSQIYGVGTNDALFKSVMDDASIRPSFFHAFIPGITVVKSERLDDHMNPLQEFQVLRVTLNKSKTTETVASLRNAFECNLMEKGEHEDFRSSPFKWDKTIAHLIDAL